MRYRFSFLLLVVGLGCQAQPLLFNDPVLISLKIRPTSIAPPSPPFTHPTNVANAYLYLSYLDLPFSGKPFGWTNELNVAQVYTNKGSTFPTNSANGVYFNGVAGDYFYQNASPYIRWSNTVDSTWITLEYSAASLTPYVSLFGGRDDLASDGSGFYLSDASLPKFFYFDDATFGAQSLWTGPSTRTLIDIAILPNGKTYTNGVEATGFTPRDRASQRLAYIGGDVYGSPTLTNAYVKYIGIFTNYTLSSTDISNLHAYVSFSPTNIPGAYFYVTYLDLPLSGKPYAWTNKLNTTMVYTNNGVTYPTNSPQGMYFTDSDASLFFNGGTYIGGGSYPVAGWASSAARLSNTVDSVWITVNYKTPAAPSYYTAIGLIDGTSASGGGFYLANDSYKFYYYDDLNLISYPMWTAPSARTTMDIAILPDGTVYTNGVMYGPGSAFTAADFPSQKMWAIGGDIRGNVLGDTYVKFLSIYTNHVFTTKEISDLHTYSAAH
jgi:hypothetical protein